MVGYILAYVHDKDLPDFLDKNQKWDLDRSKSEKKPGVK